MYKLCLDARLLITAPFVIWLLTSEAYLRPHYIHVLLIIRHVIGCTDNGPRSNKQGG